MTTPDSVPRLDIYDIARAGKQATSDRIGTGSFGAVTRDNSGRRAWPLRHPTPPSVTAQK
jgi:hypothetical protein